MKLLGARTMLAVAAAAELVVAQRAWWHVAWGEEASGGVIAVSGAETTGLTVGLAVAALGGTLLLLAVRAPGRRVVGIVLAALHAWAVLLGVRPPRPDDASVLTLLRGESLAGTYVLQPALGGWWYACAALVGVAGAVWLALRPGADAPRSVPTSAREVADSLSSWKAMDAGLDPTQEQQ